MFPKWFDNWNKDNPVDIYKPAVIVGIVGGAVVVTALLVSFGQPWATKSAQTGPRGTGMHVVEYKVDIEAPDPDVAGFDVADVEGAEVADNAEARALLGGGNAAEYGSLFGAMRQWTGIPDLLEDPENYQSAVALRMIQMTQNINENWSDHVSANGENGVTCYTCHRGQPVPNGVWFKSTPTVQSMTGWSSNQNRVTEISQSASLPSDALEEYFLNYERIGVHDLDSRVEGIPGQDGYPGIQHAERTFSLMNYFANSLGANCTLCHNTRAFYDGSQVTPQWSTASLGIALVQELNEEYILPLEGMLPVERLGALHGDVPKVGCKTCHQGQQKPLKGKNVIADYPQLGVVAE